MLKHQLESVASYPRFNSMLTRLDEIKMQLDTIATQIEQAGEIIKFGNTGGLSRLLNEFDNISFALIKTLNSFHENALILDHNFDAQLLVERKKQQSIVYSVMIVLLLVFYYFTSLALRNVNSPICLMTEAANSFLIHGKQYTAMVKGSVELKMLSQVMDGL